MCSLHHFLNPFAGAHRAALALALLLSATAGQGGEFRDKRGVPEEMIVKNMEILIENVDKQRFGKGLNAKVTRLLGLEDLGDGKRRIWYCVERDAAEETKDDPKKKKKGEEKKDEACGSDITLIPLNTGRWILQHTRGGAWKAVEE